MNRESESKRSSIKQDRFGDQSYKPYVSVHNDHSDEGVVHKKKSCDETKQATVRVRI